MSAHADLIVAGAIAFVAWQALETARWWLRGRQIDEAYSSLCKH